MHKELTMFNRAMTILKQTSSFRLKPLAKILARLRHTDQQPLTHNNADIETKAFTFEQMEPRFLMSADMAPFMPVPTFHEENIQYEVRRLVNVS